MQSRQKPSAGDTRACIIRVAEEHFRRIGYAKIAGYAKTGVTDIAAALGMSPANICSPANIPCGVSDLEDQAHRLVDPLLAALRP